MCIGAYHAGRDPSNLMSLLAFQEGFEMNLRHNLTHRQSYWLALVVAAILAASAGSVRAIPSGASTETLAPLACHGPCGDPGGGGG